MSPCMLLALSFGILRTLCASTESSSHTAILLTQDTFDKHLRSVDGNTKVCGLALLRAYSSLARTF